MPEGTHLADMPDSDTGDVPDRESAAREPVWVKLSAVIALVVVLVFVVLLLTGRGHGAGRHTGAGSGDSPPSARMHQP